MIWVDRNLEHKFLKQLEQQYPAHLIQQPILNVKIPNFHDFLTNKQVLQIWFFVIVFSLKTICNLFVTSKNGTTNSPIHQFTN